MNKNIKYNLFYIGRISLLKHQTKKLFNFPFLREGFRSVVVSKQNMDSASGLPPPPHAVPSNVVPELVPIKKPILPMTRLGTGTKGHKINLLTNHFRVDFKKTSGFFYQYRCITVFGKKTIF